MTAATLHGPPGRTEVERFRDMVQTDEVGCWEWLGGRKALGYGQMAVKRDGRWLRVIAHRYAYELWVAPIPAGMEIDHLCFNTGCVRPDHLEAVTPEENRRRKVARKRARSHCNNGHEYAVVGRYGDGKCTECVRLRARARSGGGVPHGQETHCPKGHAYEGANLRLVNLPNGGVGRRCRTCDNERNRAYQQRTV
jgi:hypothetical protein